MTLVQVQPLRGESLPRTAADAMGPSGPQVQDDMTVEVALSVIASARAGHLLICDEDSRCTALVTQAQLTAVRDSAAYTDRIRLRDLVHDRGPFTAPATSVVEAEYAMRYGRVGASPVVDEDGCALGVLVLSR